MSATSKVIINSCLSLNSSEGPTHFWTILSLVFLALEIFYLGSGRAKGNVWFAPYGQPFYSIISIRETSLRQCIRVQFGFLLSPRPL